MLCLCHATPKNHPLLKLQHPLATGDNRGQQALPFVHKAARQTRPAKDITGTFWSLHGLHNPSFSDLTVQAVAGRT